MPRGRVRGQQPLRSCCPPPRCSPQPTPAPRKRLEGESAESLTAAGAVPGRPRQSSQTSGGAAPASQLPPRPLPLRPASARGRRSLHPAGAYLQAIGRTGAETERAQAARGFRLPPHPPSAATPAAVWAAAFLGGSSAPGLSAPISATAGSRWMGSGLRGAVDRPRRGGAPVSACGAEPGVEAARCAPRAASSGSDPRQLRCARAPGTREGGAGPPGPQAPGAPPLGQAPPCPTVRPRPGSQCQSLVGAAKGRECSLPWL